MLGGVGNDNVVFIPRMALDSGLEDSPVPFRRLQFPIHLAYAMTINKSQGQTLQHIGLNLTSPVFFHGQLYSMWLFHVVPILEISKFSFLMIQTIQEIPE